ncbi:ArgS-related anticodon-binding protein NrtL [Streptomyces sp. NPDC006012]|uniref:ArgS-related anticodon-binding protein NrtL n=1 Tax=Streptomyces sp. NPDC006012 TaxID=3364739 RepID=UPI00367F90E5
MTPVELSRTVLHAVRRAVEVGELCVTVPEQVVVTVPGPGGCGDFATNVALQLARSAGKPARRVAEILLPHLAGAQGVGDVVVTGPGFINISLVPGAAAGGALVREIRDRGTGYGHSDGLAGQVVELRVPYEARAEAVADALVRIVATQSGRAEVEHSEPVNLRPVPAPEDPAPLGSDAARWALLHPAPHDLPRITADHLVQREGNPLFRIRYAHARTRALTRNAARLGFSAEPGDLAAARLMGVSTDGRESLTGSPRSSATAVRPLFTALADYPRILHAAAVHRSPDRVARHLVVVADVALPFLLTVLPHGEEKPSAAHRARLALAEATGTVLAGGLSLLGIDAPDHL